MPDSLSSSSIQNYKFSLLRALKKNNKIFPSWVAIVKLHKKIFWDFLLFYFLEEVEFVWKTDGKQPNCEYDDQCFTVLCLIYAMPLPKITEAISAFSECL